MRARLVEAAGGRARRPARRSARCTGAPTRRSRRAAPMSSSGRRKASSPHSTAKSGGRAGQQLQRVGVERAHRLLEPDDARRCRPARAAPPRRARAPCGTGCCRGRSAPASAPPPPGSGRRSPPPRAARSTGTTASDAVTPSTVGQRLVARDGRARVVGARADDERRAAVGGDARADARGRRRARARPATTPRPSWPGRPARRRRRRAPPRPGARGRRGRPRRPRRTASPAGRAARRATAQLSASRDARRRRLGGAHAACTRAHRARARRALAPAPDRQPRAGQDEPEPGDAPPR